MVLTPAPHAHLPNPTPHPPMKNRDFEIGENSAQGGVMVLTPAPHAHQPNPTPPPTHEKS